ncbi:TonB-dependent receptor [Psychroflexus salis]|uniref:TonB-dependent receptor n=1 Tax=Psychroflexus salis TaxID=1526574 RepID=A0A916ZMF8_9FLAO|nr:TonB-dependent receptor [Psychroflexus salis]GGE04710.1 TonB-dependent receptor [Psychroflexus salis]
MRKIITLIAFIGAIFFSQINAQTITGNVIDEEGIPIPGVNVAIKSIGKGAVTDFDGFFSISNLEDGTFELLASYLGYKDFTKTIEISGEQNVELTIKLVMDAQSLDQVIVTGVANPRARVASSVSFTSMGPDKIKQSSPRSTAEIFRTIPGIRSESSGGEGNSNIAVRGVPVSSGGSKYVQIQEDGLPVLLFGDISFGTADIFTRFDNSIRKIEVVRGGSASTMSSNSPGAIINFISNTGRTEGGSIGTTFGMDYESFRTDFNYGAPIGDGLYFHVGGFYRVGEGVRDVDFTGNNGGQLKFNLTKEFDNGHITVYAKHLKDRAIAYLPMPLQVSGTNANPRWRSVPGFSATQGTMHSPYLTQNVGLGGDGQLRRSSVADGMNPVSTSFGFQAAFDLYDGWKVKNNGRFSINGGAFISPFPADVALASTMLSDGFSQSNGWNSLQYANDGSNVDPNQVISRIHMFDVELNNFNNFMNDFKLTKSFDNVDFTAGFFKSNQNISMSWLWNSYLQEVSDSSPRLINIFDGAGGSLSENGLYAYGTPLWGNLHRNYDTQYNVSAPYVDVSVQANEKVNLNASLRYDIGKVSGSFTGGTQSTFDINRDGTLSVPEQNVFSIDNANSTPVNYNYNYVSYSFGANYMFSKKEAVFARYSRGAAAKADRILFTGLDFLNSDAINALDFINQAELGYKTTFKNGGLNATAFYAQTIEEGGFEATSNMIIENDYQSFGLELEGYYAVRDFEVSGTLTYTNAEIDSGDFKGNAPRRQPDLIYNVIPSYAFGKKKQNNLGLSFIGQTESYTQDNNELIMPGFVIINGFVNFAVTEKLILNVSANNILDTIGLTEAEEGSIVEGQRNFVRARPLPGRSVSLGINYKF